MGHHSEAPRLDVDVEDHAAHHQGATASNSNSSDGLGNGDAKDMDEKSMGEYELLDRYITRGGHPSQEAVAEEREHIPKWQFWRHGGDEHDDSAPTSNKPPPEWLEADIRQGISSQDVETRRKRFGWNELTAEKENQFRKFLSFFQGPILYGEFVTPGSAREGFCAVVWVALLTGVLLGSHGAGCDPCSWLAGLDRFRCHHWHPAP